MPHPQRPARHGFTMTELLIVIALIILLLSIVIVALNKATRRAEVTNTAFLMNSIAMGLVRFKDDMGYYPPILDPLRNLDDPYDPTDITDSGIDKLNRWYSITSLGEYLIGYGNHEEDGWGRTVDPDSGAIEWENETPRVGIRHPGSDGVWGATIASHQTGPAPASGQIIGRREDRMKGGDGNQRGSVGAELSIDLGKTYGPYLELSSNRLLAAYNTDTHKVVFPNEAGYQDDFPKVIVDYWGEPIRYYRLPYFTGSLQQIRKQKDSASGQWIIPSLANVIALRPYHINQGAATDVADAYADRADLYGFSTPDTTTSRALKSAGFALLSSGPDKAYGSVVSEPGDPYSYSEVRADPEGLNEDNLVEVGP